MCPVFGCVLLCGVVVWLQVLICADLLIKAIMGKARPLVVLATMWNLVHVIGWEAPTSIKTAPPKFPMLSVTVCPLPSHAACGSLVANRPKANFNVEWCSLHLTCADEHDRVVSALLAPKEDR